MPGFIPDVDNLYSLSFSLIGLVRGLFIYFQRTSFCYN